MNRARKLSPPPYYWKVSVPVPEKDHMTENYRRMKNIAVEGQKKRGPLKANFVPGVTKNIKYAHIQSKVTAALKGPPITPSHKSYSEELANRRMGQAQKFSQNGNYEQGFQDSNLGRPRPSHSSHDLRSTNPQDSYFDKDSRQSRREGSISASNVQRPIGQSISQPSVRILQQEPTEESVYNWKLSDDSHFTAKNGKETFKGSQSSVKHPEQNCHRIEFLPCDGICAEEKVDDSNLDSARSTSSRTSRACNTEETRMIGDSGPNQTFKFRGMNIEPRTRLNLQNSTNGIAPLSKVDSETQLSSAPIPKQKGIFTINSNPNNGNGFYGSNNNEPMPNAVQDYNRPPQIRNRSSQEFNIITGDQFSMDSGMRALNIKNSNKSKMANGGSTQKNGGGDLPHTLGTVPKYLKQRQQEWQKEEVAKQEAEKASHVPPGYTLLKESERIDHLRSFKTNYDSLIAELNRIPITIDTIRVRDHKIQLEKQLTRLEEAMKTFSRPTVWIKTDD